MRGYPPTYVAMRGLLVLSSFEKTRQLNTLVEYSNENLVAIDAFLVVIREGNQPVRYYRRRTMLQIMPQLSSDVGLESLPCY